MWSPGSKGEVVEGFVRQHAPWVLLLVFLPLPRLTLPVRTVPMDSVPSEHEEVVKQVQKD